jgi:hypothetical protein
VGCDYYITQRNGTTMFVFMECRNCKAKQAVLDTAIGLPNNTMVNVKATPNNKDTICLPYNPLILHKCDDGRIGVYEITYFAELFQ